MSHHTIAHRLVNRWVHGRSGGIDHGEGGHTHSHSHEHGQIDPGVLRSREGLRAVFLSLAVLGITALAQGLIFIVTDSVALLADLVHNVGDALTAIPVGAALMLRSERAERWSGKAVVGAIFISAVFSLVASVQRLVDPRPLADLAVLAGAGLIGFVGNEIAAIIRKRAGRRIDSAALVADGDHARADGLVSLGVVLSAGAVALGIPLADPIVGLTISAFILRITWRAWVTVT